VRGSRLILVGIATFAICLVAFAPASLGRLLLSDIDPLALASPTGTLWRGAGELGFAGTPLGRLHWSFAPTLLLRGEAGFDVSLQGANAELTGQAGSTLTAAHAQLAGSVDSALFGGLLARYDIALPGSLTLQDIELTLPHGARLPNIRGEAHWSGGTVDYRLSGRTHRVALPALVGFLDSSSGQPEMSVYQSDDQTPLLLARITTDGMATIGITKQFTKLLGQPWPGNEPDQAVVLEVGEKLF
jgi:Type II secretion system (T2SS), protein N